MQETTQVKQFFHTPWFQINSTSVAKLVLYTLMKNGLVGEIKGIQASSMSFILGSFQYFLKLIKWVFLMPSVSIALIFEWELSKLFQRKSLAFYDHILLLLSMEIHRYCHSQVQQRLFTRKSDWTSSEQVSVIFSLSDFTPHCPKTASTRSRHQWKLIFI